MSALVAGSLAATVSSGFSVGNVPLANPRLGVQNNGPLTRDPKEALKTEPDKNAYLTMGGHYYLFQGHEGAPKGYVTRIDLDQKDLAKRVSLVADTDLAGNKLPPLDGITWDPFTKRLLFTAESRSLSVGSSPSRWTAAAAAP